MSKIKKIICAIIIILSILFLVGCTTNPNIDGSKNDASIKFWTDDETGVQYVIYNEVCLNGGMGGITPRLNSDGTLYSTYENQAIN